jgi:Lecithin retinol acyltransferase
VTAEYGCSGDGSDLIGSVEDMGRFQPGDHLKVRRRRGYDHHGIYVTDDRVIQFGSGIRLWDKSRTAVNAVALPEFEDRGRAEVEPSGYESLLGTGYHPAADPGWKVVARAEFLLKLQHRLPYNLIGHNCEIIANLCASQNWTESYQVRRWFGRKAVADGMLLFGLAAYSRFGRTPPRWSAPVIVAWTVGGLAAIYTYNDQIRRLWNEIRDDWQAHERMLDEDPRNELPS